MIVACFATAALALVSESARVSRHRPVLRAESLATALSRELSRRSISLPPSTPSPLLPPDKVVKAVFEALQRPDVPEMGSGLDTAFAFSEPDPDDHERRSSWAFGELRGRCNWASRGLPILDNAEACHILYDDEDDCSSICGALEKDQLFLDKDDHTSEIRTFFSTLLNLSSFEFMAPPRWGAEDLVEFDLLVTTDPAVPGGSINLQTRCLLHKGGPLRDIWFIRGCTLVREAPFSP